MKLFRDETKPSNHRFNPPADHDRTFLHLLARDTSKVGTGKVISLVKCGNADFEFIRTYDVKLHAAAVRSFSYIFSRVFSLLRRPPRTLFAWLEVNILYLKSVA